MLVSILSHWHPWLGWCGLAHVEGNLHSSHWRWSTFQYFSTINQSFLEFWTWRILLKVSTESLKQTPKSHPNSIALEYWTRWTWALPAHPAAMAQRHVIKCRDRPWPWPRNGVQWIGFRENLKDSVVFFWSKYGGFPAKYPMKTNGRNPGPNKCGQLVDMGMGQNPGT